MLGSHPLRQWCIPSSCHITCRTSSGKKDVFLPIGLKFYYMNCFSDWSWFLWFSPMLWSHNKCSLSLRIVSFNQDSSRVILSERDLTSLVYFINNLTAYNIRKKPKIYFEIFWIVFIKLEKIGIFPELKLSYQVSKSQFLTSISDVLYFPLDLWVWLIHSLVYLVLLYYNFKNITYF